MSSEWRWSFHPIQLRRIGADETLEKLLDYLERTRIFPVMHLVAIRRDRYQERPWIARVLYAAFEAAQRMGRRRMRQITGLAVSFPWLEAELNEVDRLFGGDPFRYGVRENRRTLEALLDYSAEQGLAARRLSVEEIFAPETLGTCGTMDRCGLSSALGSGSAHRSRT